MRCGLLSLLALAPLAFADVEFTYPAAGASIPAGAITVKWQESGTAPSIRLLESYTLQLMVGGNDPTTAQPLINIGAASGLFSAGNEASGTITPAIAESLTNGFYLQMISTAKGGGTVTNFSPRFTITGMTGTTAAKYVAQVKALAGSTAGPATINDVVPGGAQPAAPPASAAAPVDSGLFTVPYNLQTGLTRYAPMQPIPPTKITQKEASMLFPTSPFVIAQVALPPATVLTTITAPQTLTVQSMQNTLAAQPPPRDNMAKFLARWKD